ncbi:MAG: aminopeptidase [Burkholderiales bacterium]|nr:aminopeptidase [Burkholderiales bacterium]
MFERLAKLTWRLPVVVLYIAGLAGCGVIAPSPDVGGEWKALLDDIRVFERRIGFRDTDNFADLAVDTESFPFCGQVSRWYLPYSYEDPAIQWHESMPEEKCRNAGPDVDVYFGASEALGEIGTPATLSMVSGKLDRFVYLVIHEDCHDQFDLPYGIEEALCNVITYRGMAAFASEKFRWYAGEGRAIRRYAEMQSKVVRETIAFYDRLVAVYERHGRGEIPPEALLKQRAAIFRQAERVLGYRPDDMNNVSIANDMTYSRHYPFLESVHEALGRDLARTVEFFRYVDKIKPTPAAVMKRHRIADENSIAFIRVYEEAVMETVRKALVEKVGPAPR